MQQTEHLYDTYNRLTKQRWNIGGKSFSESYTYNDPATEGASGDGSLKTLLTASSQRIHYSYDSLKRLDNATVKNSSNEELFKTAYTYKNRDGNRTSMQVETRKMLDSSGSLIAGYKYVYDAYHDFIYYAIDELHSLAKGSYELFVAGMEELGEFIQEYSWLPYARKK